MFELSQIILWILWRLRPVMAVEANLVDILQSGFALFRDDETLRMMADDPDYCATVTAALADAHAKLDLLIYLRACELTGLRSRARDFSRTAQPQAQAARLRTAGRASAGWRSASMIANGWRRSALNACSASRRKAPSVSMLRINPPPPCSAWWRT
jgi:hypothetical protein